MARIAGVDIPREKRVEISLTYIFGIGLTTSQKVLSAVGVSPDTRVKDLTEEEVNRLREYIDRHYRVEGDLRREVALNIKRLQEWIAFPSIAAENRNYPQGAEYMADLARKAGFSDVRLIPTSGKAGVFGRLNSGAATTLAIYFMYDVKQFVPDEWSSPPLEGLSLIHI